MNRLLRGTFAILNCEMLCAPDGHAVALKVQSALRYSSVTR